MQTSAVQFIIPEDPRWNSFLEGRSEADIFHHPAWSRLMADCYGYRPMVLAYIGPSDCVEAGIPLMEVSSLVRGRRWVSLPFSDHCRPLGDDPHVLHGLTEHLVRLGRESRVSSIELRAVYPPLPGLRMNSAYVLHNVDLTPGARSVYDRIHKMHRRNVRVAEQSGIQVYVGEGLQAMRAYYRLHLRTRRYQGVPAQPWKFFETVQRLLIDSGRGFLLLGYQDGCCIAGAVFLHWKHTVTYKFGASDRSSLKHKPNDLIMWTAMQWACSNGYSVFDMGRTEVENTGLRTFKSRWGAAEQPLYYSILAARAVQPSKGRLERIMHAVIQRSPLWVCRLSGELLYRHVG